MFVNQVLLQWLHLTRVDCLGVGEASWAFRNSFTLSEKELAVPNADIVFEGIDTFAVVEIVSTIC